MLDDAGSRFSDPADAASYAMNTTRKVPGLADLHRMVTLLLAEQATNQAHMLVVGAGGGMELRSMAASRGDWCFTGVDPSRAMLESAWEAVSEFADRINLLEGTIDQAPAGPFDGATCLLTLHFLDRSERLRTLQEIRKRLKSGARLVIAHHAPPVGDAERWLARSAAFGQEAGLSTANPMDTAKVMAKRLPLLGPAAEEELVREAGFVSVDLFYAAFSFRGWVASAPP
jgi:tRNA (cmo5U34)-methyltransferase